MESCLCTLRFFCLLCATDAHTCMENLFLVREVLLFLWGQPVTAPTSSCGQPVLVGELRGARAVKVQGAELESVQNGSA